MLGFVEMQTMKIGQLMDQPRSLRIQQLQHERNKRKQQAEDSAKKREAEAKKAMDTDRIHKANHGAFNALVPRMVAWQQGEGDASAVRRFNRRPELQLLVMAPSEIRCKAAGV